MAAWKNKRTSDLLDSLRSQVSLRKTRVPYSHQQFKMCRFCNREAVCEIYCSQTLENFPFHGIFKTMT